jgi:hypothetical protein
LTVFSCGWIGRTTNQQSVTVERVWAACVGRRRRVEYNGGIVWSAEYGGMVWNAEYGGVRGTAAYLEVLAESAVAKQACVGSSGEAWDDGEWWDERALECIVRLSGCQAGRFFFPCD